MAKVIRAFSAFVSFLKNLRDLIAIFPPFQLFLLASITTVISWVMLGNRFLLVIIGFDALCITGLSSIYYHRYTLRKSFVKDGMKILKDRGIRFGQIEPEGSRFEMIRKRKVFWPVVPSKNLNIIHYASINCLKYLMKSGFDVYVLVYDLHYQGRRKTEGGIINKRSIEKDVSNCISQLKAYGLRSTFLNSAKVTYKLESKSMDKNYHKSYSAVSAEIKLSELEQISLKKLTQKTKPVLRLLKPISIIAFLVSLERRKCSSYIAMTLCGADEKELYEKCHKIMSNETKDGFVPYQVYIPQFNGFGKLGNQIPGVLDDEYALTSHNKEQLKIAAKSYSYDLSKSSDSVLFLINHLLYDYNRAATFHPKCHGIDEPIDRFKFIKKCGEGSCGDFTACIIDGIFSRIDAKE